MPARSTEFARVRMALGTSTVFGQTPSEALDALAEAAVIERYPRGGVLDSTGPGGDKLWFVVEGGVLLYWLDVRGQATPVAVINPGTFYNTASLVQGGISSWRGEAARHSVLAVVPGPTVRDLVDRHREFAHCVARIVLQRYQAALSSYADAIAMPLRVRIARRLLAQALASSTTIRRLEIPLACTQGQLARTLGVSRSKLNEELRRMENDDVLRLGYGQVYVRSIEQLEAISGGRVHVF